jgi:terminase, large subunit
MNAEPRPRRYHVPAVTRAAVMRAVREGLVPLKAEPPQRLADWAAVHFQLSGDSSHQKGQWTAWPFQIGWMDAFSNDDIEQVDVQKAKRVGYTKTLVAYVAYNAAHRFRKQALWQPTDDDRDSFVKTEIDPMLDQVGAVREVRRRTKGSEDSIKLKTFRGSLAHFLGGKAARAYRRITVDAVELDEIDGFDQTIEKSADPVTLAKGRLEGAPYPKCIVGSTPRLRGFSHIERQVQAADARLRYRIQCPHCSAEHPLVWGGKKVAHGFKWDRTAAKPETTVHHVCPHCHGSINQAQYLKTWEQGAWVCDITGVRYGADRTWRNDLGQAIRAPRHVAFTGVWAAYSPQRTWGDIAREWLEARKAQRAGDNGPAQGFTNETLAETWEEDFEQTETETIRRRAKAEALPMGVVPRGACVLKNFVDVQADRWEMVTWAFGRDDESWAIDYRVIYGNTANSAEWDQKVEPLIGLSYPTAQGARLACSALGVDSGYQTHQAYAFARKHKHRNVHATKGDSQPGKPIKARRTLQDVKASGRVTRRGVAVWFIGTDTAKDLIHGRLQLEGAGPGRMHFAADLPEAFFKGLTAEHRIPVRTPRGVEHRWECPSGHRNEPLDCTVGCLFLAELDDLPRWTDRQWLRAEQALQPDLFDTPPPPPDAPETPAPTEQAAPALPGPPTKPARPRIARAAVVASDEWMSRV